jgi:hypothetical protein
MTCCAAAGTVAANRITAAPNSLNGDIAFLHRGLIGG